MSDVQLPGGTPEPALSEATIAHYRTLLADKDYEARFPEQYAALRASVDAALAATGQRLEAAPDQRSPAQRLHDQRMGVEAHDPAAYAIDLNGLQLAEGVSKADMIAGGQQLAAALQLPPYIGAPLIRNIVENLGAAPDPGAVARQLENAGLNYPEAIKSAQAALDRAAHKFTKALSVKATDLSPWALAQLAVWGQRLQQHAATRPR